MFNVHRTSYIESNYIISQAQLCSLIRCRGIPMLMWIMLNMQFIHALCVFCLYARFKWSKLICNSTENEDSIEIWLKMPAHHSIGCVYEFEINFFGFVKGPLVFWIDETLYFSLLSKTFSLLTIQPLSISLENGDPLTFRTFLGFIPSFYCDQSAHSFVHDKKKRIKRRLLHCSRPIRLMETLERAKLMKQRMNSVRQYFPGISTDTD